MTTTDQRCQEPVSTGRVTYGKCGRPVKGEGLCGIHLNAAVKRRERRERQEQEWAASKVAEQSALEAARRLADTYGIPRSEFRLAVDPKAFTYTGGLTLSPAAVEALLRAL